MESSDAGEKAIGDAEIDPPPTPKESQILKEICRKQYEEGDAGKVEALRDLQSVFDELYQDKVIPQPFNVMASSKAAASRALQASRSKDPTTSSADKTRKGLRGNPQGTHPLVPVQQPFLAQLPPLPPRHQSDQNLSKSKRQRLQAQTLSLPAIPALVNQRVGTGEVKKTRRDLPHTTFLNISTTETESDRDGPERDDVFLSPTTESSTHMFRPPNLQTTSEDTESVHMPPPLDLDSPTEVEIEDTWKGDLARLMTLKPGADTNEKQKAKIDPHEQSFQLKYKEPTQIEQLSLHRILGKMPNLTTLMLDGSEIESLRELGNSLESLQTLSVCRCSMKSLDGTLALPNLRTLVASNNHLEYAIQCSCLSGLNHLDLSYNPITDLGHLAHLKACSRLQSLKLMGTPVGGNPNFQEHIKKHIPHLKEIQPISGFDSWPHATVNDEKEAKVEKAMRQHFEDLYRKNFKKKATAQSVGNTSTDDNFEGVLFKSAKMKGIISSSASTAVSMDSYISEDSTTSGQQEIRKMTMLNDLSGVRDNDVFYSEDSSDADIFEDAEEGDV